MASEEFGLNVLRMVAAELHLSNALAASQAMFGKGYFSLSPQEKVVVDQTVFAQLASNYQSITPELLGQEQRQPVGFGFPKDPPAAPPPPPEQPPT